MGFQAGFLRAAVVAVGFAVMTVGAQAATVEPCSSVLPDATNRVTVNAGCELLTSADNDSEASVSGMFGINGWTQAGKVEDDDENGVWDGSDGGLTLTGGLQSGAWSFDPSILSMWENVMLVFKGGDKALPEAVVGYLVEVANGEYLTPFFDLKCDKNGNNCKYNAKDISHVSIYVSGPMTPVPLPAAGWMMLAGLGGLAALRRRRKAA